MATPRPNPRPALASPDVAFERSPEPVVLAEVHAFQIATFGTASALFRVMSDSALEKISSQMHGSAPVGVHGGRVSDDPLFVSLLDRDEATGSPIPQLLARLDRCPPSSDTTSGFYLSWLGWPLAVPSTRTLARFARWLDLIRRERGVLAHPEISSRLDRARVHDDPSLEASTFVPWGGGTPDAPAFRFHLDPYSAVLEHFDRVFLLAEDAVAREAARTAESNP